MTELDPNNYAIIIFTMAEWSVIRITIHPRYNKPGIYKRIERSLQNRLRGCEYVEEALEQGWMDEVRPAGGKNPSRRFAIYLTDSKYYTDIPITFSLKKNGQIL